MVDRPGTRTPGGSTTGLQAPPAPALWSTRLEPEADSVADARRLTGRFLRQFGDEFTSTVVLIVSELVTNAVRHGQGAAQLTVVRARDHVRVEVIDSGSGAVRMRMPSLAGGGGFGLHLVELLARTWGHEPGPPTRVCAEFALPDSS